MTVDVTNAGSVEEGIRWWEEITGHGGEGMVVKPLDFVASGRRWPVQPGIKSRGREYLRIIYGPEYDLPKTWTGCEDAVCRRSARSLPGSSRSEWRRWSVSSAANPFTRSTCASSESSLSRANP